MSGGDDIHTILRELEETVEKLAHCNEEDFRDRSASEDRHPAFTGAFPEDLVVPIANIMTLHLSMGARLLLLGCLLQNSIWGEKRYCFNEIAAMVGISDRTAYRALKEIKTSGFFEVDSRPGIGVSIELDCIRHRLKDEGKTLLCGSSSTSGETDLFH
ncbi:MAG: hypothetical protein ACLFN0_00530 [Thermovirgaceae bacterium]